MLTAVLITVGLFVLALVAKNVWHNLCAICVAVSGTWLIGLVAGLEPTVLALLMGGTSVGLMYYLSSALPEKLSVFKLPFLLTSSSLFYFILKLDVQMQLLGVLAVVWLIFTLIYFLRDGVAKGWFKKVVECCKNW